MPEGPEVWILSKAINEYYNTNKTVSVGKHLIVNDINENWSFGLTGKVSITDTNSLIKMNTGWIYGEQLKYTDYLTSVKDLGLDWMIASKEELEKEIDKWIKSKKKLAALILDQRKICGIGVAWGSEILFKADLRPDIRACDQVLNKLVDSIIEIRKKIQIEYKNELIANQDNLKEFINDWYTNLYEIREMNVYKIGSQLKVLERSWWVLG
jgi:formamidopyrimidine-DNA glycosylase